MGKLINEKRENIKCSIIVISAAYFLTNGFILFLTGTWWDEKTWFFSTKEQMWNVSLQLGKPAAYFVLRLMNNLPEFLGRLLIFLTFYVALIGVYILFSQIPYLRNIDVTLMVLVYIAIPTNDAKVMRAIYPYSLGHMLFIVGFVFLVLLQKYEYKNYYVRIVTLCIFFFSFCFLNSNLIFYGVALLYIMLYLIKYNKLKESHKYIDFVCLPFIYYFIKNVFFHPYGIYEEYNSITLQSLISALCESIGTCKYCFVNTIMYWKDYAMEGITVAIGLMIGIFLFILKKQSVLREDYDNTKPLGMKVLLHIAIGCIVLYAGVYAYVAVGLNCQMIGVSGRNSVLIAIGMAILIYSLILIVPNYYFKIFICLVISVCGICHFNYYYLLYQRDYYRQQDFIYELKENIETLNNTKNILYLTDDNSKINVTRFYSLNENGVEAFGDQTHFFMNGIADYDYLKNDDKTQLLQFVNSGDYQMSEYQIDRTNDIEAILIYNNDISIKDTVKLKLYELFSTKIYEESLYNKSNLTVIFENDCEYIDIINTLL